MWQQNKKNLFIPAMTGLRMTGGGVAAAGGGEAGTGAALTIKQVDLICSPTVS